MSDLIINVDVDSEGRFSYTRSADSTEAWVLGPGGSITPPMGKGSGTFEFRLAHSELRFAGFNVCPGVAELPGSHWASPADLQACHLEPLSPSPWPSSPSAVAEHLKLELSYGISGGGSDPYVQYRLFVQLSPGHVVHHDPRIYNDPVTDPP